MSRNRIQILRFLLWYGVPLCLTLPYLYHGFFVPGTIPPWSVYLMVFGGLGYIHVLNAISLYVQYRRRRASNERVEPEA